MPATFSWISLGTGDWTTAANWADISSGETPAISAPGRLDIVSLATATVTGTGAADTATFFGVNTIAATLTLGTLSVASATSLQGGASVTAGVVTGSGSITVAGTGSTLDAGATSIRTFIASGGGMAETGDVIIQSGSVQVSDQTSRIEIGHAGTGAVGELTIDNGNTVSGVGELFGARIVVNGAVVAQNIGFGLERIDSTGTPGHMVTSNTASQYLSGTGSVEVLSGGSVTLYAIIDQPGLSFHLDGNAKMELDVDIAAGNTIALAGTGNTLDIVEGFLYPGSKSTIGNPAPPSIAATIAGFDSTDTIAVIGNATSITGASYAAGVLTVLSGTNIVSALTLAGDYTGDRFDVVGDDITLATTANSFTWTATAAADWGTASNWTDITSGQTPAVAAPGNIDSVTLSGASVTGTGFADTATFSGSNTIGATLTIGTLALGAATTLQGGATVTAGTLASAGNITLAGTDSVLNANAATIAGTLQGAGRAVFGDLALLHGTIWGGQVEVGNAGTGSARAVTIDSGHTLSGTGELFTDIVDNGVITLSTGDLGLLSIGSSGAPGMITTIEQVGNTLRGTGTVEIQAGGTVNLWALVDQPGLTFRLDGSATMEIYGSIAAGNTIALNGVGNQLHLVGGALFAGSLSSTNLAAPPAVAATITGFNPTDRIVIDDPALAWNGTGIGITSASYAAGILTLLNGTSIVSTLSLSGTFAGERFDVIPGIGDPGGTILLDSVFADTPSAGTGTGDSFAWTGNGATPYAWNDAANWIDITQGQTPAIVAPGSLDTVAIDSAILMGNGSAAAVTLTGTDTVLGTLNSGQVIIGGSLTVAGGATVSAGTVRLSGTGAALSLLNGGSVVTGALALGTITPTLVSPGVTIAGANSIVVDASSALLVGSGTAATVGALTVDAGYSISGAGSIAGNIFDNGLIASDGLAIGTVGAVYNGPHLGATYSFANTLGGSGTLEVLTNGSLILSSEVLTSGLTFQVDGGGTLDIAAPIVAGNTIVLLGSHNVLILDATYYNHMPASITGDLPELAASIVGFDASDTLIIGSNYGPNVTGVTWSGGTLVVQGSSGVPVATLTMPGAFDGLGWNDQVVTANFSTHDEITLSCFAAGTLIDTPGGPLAVERLQAGDTVLTADGPSPAVWIGHRRVNCAAHPHPERVWPVRVQPGAFGPGQPRRTLLLSPDHAVFVGDVLVPVRYLVNGSTIAQLACGTVTYFHVELAEHTLLYAEGLAVESYLDVGDRSNFANSGGVTALFPDFVPLRWEAAGYAPLVVTGPQLMQARAFVAACSRPPSCSSEAAA